MKKTLKRAAALLLSAVLAVGMFAGCGKGGSGEGSGADTSKYVELTMYLLGSRTPDFDEVYGKINEILKEKLNCTVNVKFLSWGEHDTKYSLLFNSGENFDLIFTASGWAHYEQTVALGGFYPLSEEFIKTYAPDIWKVVPAMAWNQAKINGTIYMVPNYQNEFGQDVLAVRGDLMKKFNIDKITNWDELVAFYKACAKNGIYASQGAPTYQFWQDKGMTTTGGTPKNGELILYNTQDPNDLNFYYVLDWAPYKDYCFQAKDMADAGCWSKDVLNSTDERQDGLLNGRTAGLIWNMGTCRNYAKQANSEHADWNVTIVDPVTNWPKKVNSYINNGVAINAESKNKERAMMVLNEFYTNREVFDLAMLGIEGKHWEAVGDDQFKIIDESNFGVDSNCNWGWTNCEIKRKEYIENRTALDDTFDAFQAVWNNNVKAEHPYDGFNFDPSSVSTQFAAVEAALGAYMDPLANGLMPDVNAALNDLKKQLDNAGIQDIITELKRQAEEFLKTQQK